MSGKNHPEMVKAGPAWAELGQGSGCGGCCQDRVRGSRGEDLDGFCVNKMGNSAGWYPAQVICSMLLVMAALAPFCALPALPVPGLWSTQIQPPPGSHSSIPGSSGSEKIYLSCAKVLCCHRHSALRDFRGIYGLINKEPRLTGRNANLKPIPEPRMGQKAAAHEGWLHTAFLGCSVPQAWPE